MKFAENKKSLECYFKLLNNRSEVFRERTFLETKSGNCYQIEFDKDWSINSITKRKCKTKRHFFSFKGHFHLWTHFGVKLLC